MWAIEGDIKGCFDNINHRLLLQKLWKIGIHDKRVLKIISQMLKAGYMENDLFHATELGTPQEESSHRFYPMFISTISIGMLVVCIWSRTDSASIKATTQGV